ncbi:hypothetical protein DES53_104408 [Roseimicrobium gellanilyticum]|uniref:EF-hand domain-containing protein n=1 Tax=Roseimicrobium gellanilyticum TaxID=748857 RepID=A0A366HP73_9BACT|nr:hypothetical protein [Roseimicrobium gellanilyticum]RBP44586.1 hypothetical protein DES53_104408 [Roseimicrobium gellanilyticum]
MHGLCFSQDAVVKPSTNTTTPRVWIFNGTPGDDVHHDFYEANLQSLRSSLTQRFGIPAANITVLYGPKSAGYDGPCTREAMLAELETVVAHTKTNGAGPAWIILEGHANGVPGGAMFNLPGPDLSMREIGTALKECSPQTPLVVWGTTTVSTDLIKRVSGPGRYVITASSAEDKESETEFPKALAQALAAEASDANQDGVLTLTELFLATYEQVLAIYKQGNYVVTEHAQLDGNGDGKGTQRPAPEDAEPAQRIGLAVGGGRPKFE